MVRKSAAVILLWCFLGLSWAQDGQVGFPSKLSWDLAMNVLGSQDGNVVFAPTSVVTALGMLYEGLDGETREEVGSALGFPEDDKEFEEEFKAMQTGGSDVLKSSNMVIVLQAAKINSDYAKRVKDVFGASPFQHGFKRKPEVAAGSINQKVAEETDGKIKDLMPPGSISANTKFVLANAVLFKDEWLERFEKENTTERPFTTASGNTIQVPTMIGKQNSAGYEVTNDGMEVLEIPFQDPRYSFVVVMPPKGAGKDELEAGLLGLQDKILDPTSLPRTAAIVHLPKFSAETRLKLAQGLSNWYPETTQLFQPGAAPDFGRMAKNARDFYLEEVHHKSVMDVTEEGVEAAGATGLAVTLYSFFEPDTEIAVDRTFAHFIVDNDSNGVVFAGIVDDPTVKN